VTAAECASPLIDPVTVTVKGPPDEAVQDRVEVTVVVVGFRATFVGLRVQLKPTVGETVSVKPTVPVNPSRPVSVTVEDPLVPEKTKTAVGLAAIEKSWTV
jgi:hypothetical protein